jgi:hypothetical protein
MSVTGFVTATKMNRLFQIYIATQDSDTQMIMANLPTKTNYYQFQTSIYCSENVYLKTNILKNVRTKAMQDSDAIFQC